jgi:hypothetical protein
MDEVIQKVDLEAVLDRLDMNAIAQRIDIDTLVQQTDLAAIIAKSSGGVAGNALDWPAAKPSVSTNSSPGGQRGFDAAPTLARLARLTGSTPWRGYDRTGGLGHVRQPSGRGPGEPSRPLCGFASRFVAFVVDEGAATGVFALALATISFAASVLTGKPVHWNRSDFWVSLAFVGW